VENLQLDKTLNALIFFIMCILLNAFGPNFISFQELEFRHNTQSTIEQLIFINNELHQLEAAQGLLKYAREQLQVPIKTAWYEKVQRWTAALELYDKQQLDAPDDLNVTLGRMRCMTSLSDWEGVSNLVDSAMKQQDQLNVVQRAEVATIALSAALNLMRWDVSSNFNITIIKFVIVILSVA
jgi:FKBP12-rapamycin complex-associated protein